MQAKDIKLGESYALNHGGKLVRFVPTEQVTYRDVKTTTNRFNGRVFRDDNPHVTGIEGSEEVKGVTVDRLDGAYALKKAMLDRYEANQAESKRVEAEKQAKRRRLVDLLTGLIGEEPVDWSKIDNGASYDYRYRSSLPVQDGSYEVSIKAQKPGEIDNIEKLIAVLESLGK